MVVAAPLPRRTLRRLARRAETVEARLAALGAFAMFTPTVLWPALVAVTGQLRSRRVVLRHTTAPVPGPRAGGLGGGTVLHVAAQPLGSTSGSGLVALDEVRNRAG